MADHGRGTEPYATRWRARDYLEQYYATAVTADDVANARFAATELRRLGRRYARALEVGCGPTVHHIAPFAPWLDRVTLADYLPENLDEVSQWWRAEPTAFDWDRWLGSMLAAEADALGPDGALAGDSTAGALRRRQARMRDVLAELSLVDLRAASMEPNLPVGGFDLVLSYYCLECVGATAVAWRQCLQRLTDWVAPGGVLFLGVIRRARSYRVFDAEFPVACIDEDDLRTELPRLGFPLADLVLEFADVPEFAEQGFDEVLCVRAVKAN